MTSHPHSAPAIARLGRVLGTLLVALSCGAVSGVAEQAPRRFVPRSAKPVLEPVRLDHSFRASGAGARLALEFSPDGRAAAGELVLSDAVLLGPLPTGGAVVPAGRHALELAPWGAAGGLRLVLRTQDGMRLAIPLAAAARSPLPPPSVETFGSAGGGSWPIAVHLPAASGLFVLDEALTPSANVGAAGADEAGDGPRRIRRARSRSELLEQRRDRRGVSAETRPARGPEK